MAKQNGLVKIQGKLGDITYVKTKNGYLARESSTVSGSRIATDSAFQRTRENNAEFKTAAAAGKTLRRALNYPMQFAKDGKVSNRVFSAMMQVVKADGVNARGKRKVLDAQTEMLEGFELNSRAGLQSTLIPQFSSGIDRVSGTLQVNIPSLVPVAGIVAPPSGTHFSFISCGSEINFDEDTYNSDFKESDIYEWSATATPDVSLINQVSPGSANPLFLLLGVRFYENINGAYYPLKAGEFNPLTIIKVAGV